MTQANRRRILHQKLAPSFSMTDEDYMRLAIAAGRRTAGATGTNPAVGCVIVNAGAVVAVAATAQGGRPHAETLALDMAADRAAGATVYVTLEPCSHHGRTPPCADALLSAGVGRVVTAIDDPDPRVSGAGHARLRKAGIAVTEGVLADEVRHELAGYLSRHLNNRPQVILKLAVSADDKITAERGKPTRITGPEVKARVHLMRSRADAIMVGVSTVLADNPDLTCRLPGLSQLSPVRVVSDSKLSIPLDSRLVETADLVPVWVMTTEAASAQKRSDLEARGVRVITCASTKDGKVELADMMARLAQEGISTVLAEGGAHMARALLEQDLVDKVHLFSAPGKLGEGGLAALAGLPLDTVRASAKFRHAAENEKLGKDWLATYVRVR
jgi:diaminohydroxyphosphoribosylaminopyrimidine deaminase/5-amino-6-(5-phosphoribosylamino)uracil reductase